MRTAPGQQWGNEHSQTIGPRGPSAAHRGTDGESPCCQRAACAVLTSTAALPPPSPPRWSRKRGPPRCNEAAEARAAAPISVTTAQQAVGDTNDCELLFRRRLTFNDFHFLLKFSIFPFLWAIYSSAIKSRSNHDLNWRKWFELKELKDLNWKSFPG